MTRDHIDLALTRLAEVDHLTDFKPFDDEWWAAMAAEVGWDADELAESCNAVAKGRSSDLPGATRGLLVGLLAGRYEANEVSL